MNRQLNMQLACLGLLMAGVTCSRVSPTSQRGQLIFSHDVHVAQADCVDCHEGVGGSKAIRQGQFIPRKKKCEECHDVKSAGQCKLCHQGPKSGVRFGLADRKLKFSHAAHQKTVKQCKKCHAENRKEGAVIAGHDTCNASDCHHADYKIMDCEKCHSNLSRYRLGTVAEIKHGPGFSREHGPLARQAARACAQCHDQTYCAGCHGRTNVAKPSILFPEEIETRFIHRGDFLSRHAIEAQSSPGTCRKCHGQQHCRSCHAFNGLAVATEETSKAGKLLKAHPAGWMTRGASTFHGHKARQDIGRCASCHDRGGFSNCVGCHRVGGMGGNPHPPGWSWSNKGEQCRKLAMCRTCHADGKGCD